MMCTVCGADPQSGRALCSDCAHRLDNPPGFCIEHIAWTEDPPSSSGAVLVDQWGRPHFLRDKTVVGRAPFTGIAVLERSISRQHAELYRDGDNWHVRDLDSHNGTLVADAPAEPSTALESDSIITFGDVAFYFLARPEPIPVGDIEIATAVKPVRRNEHTEAKTSTTLRLAAPPGNVGGIAELDGVAVRLSPIQFELITVLAERICAEADQSILVRGFVRSAELIEMLPWDTPDPVANNVKQLVRRVRTAMESAGFLDVIESRHRFGYRLRLMPQNTVDSEDN